MGVPKVRTVISKISALTATPVFQVDIRAMAYVQSAHSRQQYSRVKSPGDILSCLPQV